MLKKLAASLAIALATTAAHTASAMTIEAVWDVQLNSEQWDFVAEEFTPLDIPGTGQIRTRFTIQGGTTTDYGNDTQTIFPIQQGAILESDFHGSVTPDPLPNNPEYFSQIVADSHDYSYGYRDSLNIRDWMSVFDENISWHYQYSFTIDRFSEPKSGTGADDVEFTEAYLFDFLTDFLNNPDEFQTSLFLDDNNIDWAGASGPTYLDAHQRRGTFRLTSLRRVDVPEPPALALIGAGLLSVALLRRRRIAEIAGQ